MAKGKVTFTREVNLFKEVARALPLAVDEIIGETLEEETKPVAVQLCPKRTGALSKTIRVVRVRRLLWKLVAGQMAVDGVFVDYEKWVEFGTHDTPAQPFMSPAMQLTARGLLRKLRNLERYLKKHMRR